MKYTSYTKEDLMLYNDLCKAVNKINKEAFHYMVIQAIEQETFYPSNILSGCFLWYETPQGEEFWQNIQDQLDIGGYYD